MSGTAAVPPRVPAQAQDQRDSVRGTIGLAGSAPAPIVSLVMKDGRSYRLTGPLPLNLVVQLEGLEVVVYGRKRRRADDPVEMETFSVRGRGGYAARDGILRREPGRDVLELSDGRRLAVTRLPEHLASANGKRVWIAGPLEAPTSAGVIDPERQFSAPE